MKADPRWHDWRWQMSHRIVTLAQLEPWVNLTVDEKRAVSFSEGRFRMAIPPYWADLVDPNDPACPIRRQTIPTMDELKSSVHDLADPLGEEQDTVAPGVVHRYPDRILFLVNDVCAMYCRYCTRKRIVGGGYGVLRGDEFQQAMDYIRRNKKIRDVLISGGDPLTMSDERLEQIISTLRAIDHVEFIRLGTRYPVTLPQRVTPELCAMLKKYHPLWMSIHFNHPKEVTPEVHRACGRLADAGIPLGSQTVLLRGINDKPTIMMKLMHELLKIRVRPYYIYQCDLVPGSEHFRTPISTGIKIIEALRGHTTGYAVPTFVIDAPGGGGKIPLMPDYVISKSRKGILLKNYEGKVYFYPERASSEITNGALPLEMKLPQKAARR
ncbi:MAG: KamA family radical SAM protein [Elusimicrobia bacterium]|nr:KamA family radical SAM protein [Elusimicrobiota bacterium]